MPRVVDLHTHSVYSDGKMSAQGLVNLAVKRKVEYFSLTDHDTMCGVEETARLCKECGINFIPGVEISTNVCDMLHILGYGIDPSDKTLNSFLELYRTRRLKRAEKIVASLKKAGVSIDIEDAITASAQSVSRAHIADALVKKKIAHNRAEAFRKFLVPGAVAYIKGEGPSAEEAIGAIKKAGGISVIAHPGVAAKYIRLDEWVPLGLGGLEAFYPLHSAVVRGEFISLARKYGLLVTAGTDFHGAGAGYSDTVGVSMEEEFLRPIVQKLFNGV